MICLPLNISDGFPNCGGTEGIHSQGVHGAGGNNDGNESVFSAQECSVHHDDT